MNIRQATINDLETISEVERICFPPNEACSKESFHRRLLYYPDHFLLLYEDERLISFVDGAVVNREDLYDEMYDHPEMHDPNGCWQMIFDVNTLPGYRQKGYAGRLIREMITLARREGRKGLVLTCKEEKIHYYASFGFVNEGVAKNSVHGGVVWYQMRLRFEGEDK